MRFRISRVSAEDFRDTQYRGIAKLSSHLPANFRALRSELQKRRGARRLKFHASSQVLASGFPRYFPYHPHPREVSSRPAVFGRIYALRARARAHESAGLKTTGRFLDVGSRLDFIPGAGSSATIVTKPDERLWRKRRSFVRS